MINGQNSRQRRTVNFNGGTREVIVSTTMTHLMVYDLENGKLLASSAVVRPRDFDYDALLFAAVGNNQSFIGETDNKKRQGKAASRGKRV